MSEATTLPSNRDEAWRYSDIAALADFDLERLGQWREIAVPPGESHRECILVEDEGGTRIERLRVTVGEGATCEIFAVNAGGRFARIEVAAQLAENSHFEFGGVTLGGEETTREFVTSVDHALPGASSNQVVRSVHWGRGTGNFLGRIGVARHAQKTDAVQDFKGLLLEKGASANAKPELEIFADDVKCAHGAAVGALDEKARHYMATRGIPPAVARRLLVRAFIADAFVALGEEEQREALLEAALEKLGDMV